MVKLYARLIREGRLMLASVPARWREAVEQLLSTD